MPVIFFHRTRESTEYTVLTHIGVWVKNQKLVFFVPDANSTSLILILLQLFCVFAIKYFCRLNLCKSLWFQLYFQFSKKIGVAEFQ